jgi:hypothetical protein
MIKRCRMWLFAVVVIGMGELTSGLMAAQATASGAADSFLSALLSAPQQQTTLARLLPAWLPASLQAPSGRAGIGSAAIAANTAAPFGGAEPGRPAIRTTGQTGYQTGDGPRR